MKSDEELDALVTQMAADSTIELEHWPDVLEYMLKRLDWIAYNSFPLPKPPPLLGPKPPASISRESTVLIQPSEEQDSNPSTQAVAENRDSSQTPTNATSDPSAPTVDVEATQPDPPTEAPTASQDQPPTSEEEKFLPPTLLSSLTSITTLLSTSFTHAPPHTIQRFAELLLKPNKHYRSLAKFLRACNRVISVTSGLDKFPLPISHDGTHPVSNTIPIGSGLVNENEEITGATLTPIPWASAREYVANQNGDAAGSPASGEAAATLSGDDGAGISQGELLRKEQEAGVVPLSQAGGALENSGNAPGEIHVSGPPELGAADLGPQPKGLVFGDKPAEETKGDEMDVDEKVEEKKEEAGPAGEDS
ncbi:hypothetical protein ABW20_dc0103751 [Dactylellina cionopaga]|nr:hypothetical protein ABW20_dc0103751 [Dactylellina cionopaga]